MEQKEQSVNSLFLTVAYKQVAPRERKQKWGSEGGGGGEVWGAKKVFVCLQFPLNYRKQTIPRDR